MDQQHHALGCLGVCPYDTPGIKMQHTACSVCLKCSIVALVLLAGHSVEGSSEREGDGAYRAQGAAHAAGGEQQ